MWALMGMYPSADLSYGMDLGEWEYSYPEDGQDHEELEWLTWELWDASWEWETASATYLKSKGVEGVSLSNYGHHDHPRMALTTKGVGCSGWGDLTVITADKLAVTDDDTRLLRAWNLLFPGKPPGEVAWRLSANFD